MSKLKVAIITSGYLPIPAVNGGGVETLMDYLINENETEQELAVTVFSSFDAEAEIASKKYNQSSIHFVKTLSLIKGVDKMVYWFSRNVFKRANPTSYRYIFQRLSYIKKVGLFLASHEFDRVIIENSATLFGILKAKKNRQKYCGKYYFHMHNEVTNDFGYGEDIRNAKKIIGVSQYINSTMEQKFPEMKTEQFVVLKNGINQARFTARLTTLEKNKLRKQYSILDSDIVFMFSGRIAAEKGLLEALLAFEKADLANAKFIVVGSTFFMTTIKSQYHLAIDDLATKLKDRVIMVGFIPNNLLGMYYEIADVCVLPSIWDEPAGLTMIEALSIGKALITTNSGGIPEYIPAGSAVILDKDSPDFLSELAETMRLLYTDSSQRELLQKAGLSLADTFSTTTMYKEFIKILE
ncbi:glycosyltransferase family 4 protein [uncultured Vagococcus sp.]|uniref:glycosyltransferase family 4 protein n=1 Tax=uncultured Vagococcus sp. TaxID=189676 RepID=UPI0028D7732F|nr:glycosyltransferase family 4 protein [uncultured Vagococcus sp.]